MAKTTRTEVREDNSELIQALTVLKPTEYKCPLNDKTVMLTPVFSPEPVKMAGLADIRTKEDKGLPKGQYMNWRDHQGVLFLQCSYSGSVGPCCRHCEQVKGYTSPPEEKT